MTFRQTCFILIKQWNVTELFKNVLRFNLNANEHLDGKSTSEIVKIVLIVL